MQKSHNTRIAHSSEKQDWGTPPELLKKWMKEFDFYVALDPCTSKSNPLKAKRFYTKKDDGLTKSWDISRFDPITQKTLGSAPDIEVEPAVYVNPGYGVDYVLTKPECVYGETVAVTNLQKLIIEQLVNGVTSSKNISVNLKGRDSVIPNPTPKGINGHIRIMRELGIVRKQTCADWVKKAYDEYCLHGSMIVMLLPYRAPKYYFKYILPYLDNIYALGGNPLDYYFPLEKRIKFVGAKNSAPFDSCLWILRSNR